MLKHVPRVFFVFAANIILDYILFFLTLLITTDHPFDEGFLMFSPASFAVLFLVIPSIVTGLCNGFLINVTPLKFYRQYNFIFLISFICGLIVALFWSGLFSVLEGRNYIISAFCLVMLAVFSISNVLTILLTKRIFLNKTSAQSDFTDEKENFSA
jgi:hypothetical protein